MHKSDISLLQKNSTTLGIDVKPTHCDPVSSQNHKHLSLIHLVLLYNNDLGPFLFLLSHQYHTKLHKNWSFSSKTFLVSVNKSVRNWGFDYLLLLYSSTQPCLTRILSFPETTLQSQIDTGKCSQNISLRHNLPLATASKQSFSTWLLHSSHN